MSEKDIVEEARELISAIGNHTLDKQEKLRDLLRALADEVERLRRDNKTAELTIEGLLDRLGSRNED